MSDRILSRHGNVIAADFRQKHKTLDLSVTISTTILHMDERVMLMRSTCSIEGDIKPEFTTHFLADLTTGHIVHL